MVGDEKRPSLNSTLSTGAFSTSAATFLPLAISSGTPLAITVAAWRIERPECEPPPTLTMSVSPMMMLMHACGTAIRSATTWAKLVSWPWPLGCVPITTSTTPFGFTVISVRSFGEPIEDST